ncbi:MAG TPA: hypothetical protein VJ652_12765 [Noviherbaspirillum sp.]|nr:hypothetical protein [Noviherbaspirillum sp.]
MDQAAAVRSSNSRPYFGFNGHFINDAWPPNRQGDTLKDVNLFSVHSNLETGVETLMTAAQAWLSA